MKSKITILLIAITLAACSSSSVLTPTTIPTTEPLSNPTNTPSPIPTNTPVPPPTQIGGGSGKLIFEYYKTAYEKEFPDLKGDVNLFVSKVDGTNIAPISKELNSSTYIESISSDGRLLIVSSYSNNATKGDLYLLHVNLQDKAIKLASVEATNSPHAIFLDKARIVYVGQGSDGYGFYTINIDGSDEKKIGAPTGEYPGILSSDGTRIYWYASTKESFVIDSNNYARGDFQTLWWTKIDGSEQGKLESNGYQMIYDKNTAFSPDGKKIAWIPQAWQGIDCSGSAYIWSSWVRDGVYTQHATNRQNVFYGKTVDIAYAEDMVRRCYLIYVAPLSDMNNPIKIALIPPLNPVKDDFMYHNAYNLIWTKDSSKIFAFDNGLSLRNMSGGKESFGAYYPIALYDIDPNTANPKLGLVKVFSIGFENIFDTLMDFSPDGRLLLFANYDPYTNFHVQEVNILDLVKMSFVNGFTQNLIPDTQERRVGKIFWLP
ncbi:MAG: PD40 domain-containing protein [Chloroflexi bacterium]|nr:PD40 domain-containing protein [Chloroflexota bacterium]MBI3341055.1 PD40 domain-containing protein [Chloroflexota bacterium]